MNTYTSYLHPTSKAPLVLLRDIARAHKLTVGQAGTLARGVKKLKVYELLACRLKGVEGDGLVRLVRAVDSGRLDRACAAHKEAPKRLRAVPRPEPAPSREVLQRYLDDNDVSESWQRRLSYTPT